MTTRPTLDPIEATTKAVAALLSAIDIAPAAGAVTAYTSAIRRHGVHLAASAGAPALDKVLARIRAKAPDKVAAQDRARIVSLAWEGIAA